MTEQQCLSDAGFQPFCVGASPPSRAGHRQALPAVPPPTDYSMDTHIPQADTYAPTATPPTSAAAAANLSPNLQMQNFMQDHAGRQQAQMGLHRQDNCNASPSRHLSTLWWQGLQWLADSQQYAQKIVVDYEAGQHAVQPRAPTGQHVQDLNTAPMHHELLHPPQHSSPAVAQVSICHAPPGMLSHTPTVDEEAQHWATDLSYSEDHMHSTRSQHGPMLSSAQTWSASAAAALKSWEEAGAADLVSEMQPTSISWQASDPICNRGASMTNGYGQDSDLHTALVAAKAVHERIPLHLPKSTKLYNDDDDDDGDLQSALAMSLAQFEVEDMLRTTAESLPVKRQNGGGHVWQSKHFCCDLAYSSGMSAPAISMLSASAFKFEFSRLAVMTCCMTAESAVHCQLLYLCWRATCLVSALFALPRASVDIFSKSANFLLQSFCLSLLAFTLHEICPVPFVEPSAVYSATLTSSLSLADFQACSAHMLYAPPYISNSSRTCFCLRCQHALPLTRLHVAACSGAT